MIKITEKELMAVKELCAAEEINAKNFEMYAQMIPDSESVIRNMFESEASRSRKNIKRLMKYVK